MIFFGVKLIIGFIGFGEVASTLTKKLQNFDVDVITSLNNRSEKSKQLAIKSNIKVFKTYGEIAKLSDILISSNNPKSALDVAKKYGKLTKRIFLDLNNISPKTAENINEIFQNEKGDNTRNNFINGAIIGRITNENHKIIVSGIKLKEIIALNDYGLNITPISENIEDVSKLKMLRSMYTKGLTAILFETFDVASSLGLSDELFDILSLTEGKNFKKNAKSRINSLAISNERKFQEMEEVLTFLEEINNDKNKTFDSTMTIATKNKFKDFIK